MSEAVGEDELLAGWQILQHEALLESRMERLRDGVPGRRGMVARRTDGRIVPDDVLSRQQLLPVRSRLEGAQPRTHRGAGSGHLLHVATRKELASERHHTRVGLSAQQRLRTRLLPLQVLHRRHERHIPLCEERALSVSVARSAYDVAVG